MSKLTDEQIELLWTEAYKKTDTREVITILARKVEALVAQGYEVKIADINDELRKAGTRQLNLTLDVLRAAREESTLCSFDCVKAVEDRIVELRAYYDGDLIPSITQGYEAEANRMTLASVGVVNAYEARIAELEQELACANGNNLIGYAPEHVHSPAQVQEPVAWMLEFSDSDYGLTKNPSEVELWKHEGYDVDPLYLHPPSESRELRDEIEGLLENAETMCGWCATNVDKWHFHEYDNLDRSVKNVRALLGGEK